MKPLVTHIQERLLTVLCPFLQTYASNTTVIQLAQDANISSGAVIKGLSSTGGSHPEYCRLPRA